jgi:succinate dehydrogenase / fumarate reductase membrane anchor subunit
LKNVVTHWKIQRFTALAIIPLSLWLLYSIVCLKGFSFQRSYDWFSNPLNGILIILFFVISFLHLKLGLQIIVEDYIKNIKGRNIVILIIDISCYIFAGIAILSVFSILF